MSASSAEMLMADSGAASAQLFVINLCASTSPMALAHPSAPELKRYTFFVSRQREDGRERFRLHMGYFATQQAAEALLPVVRDVYPAAWAGLAPTSGAPRRGRIAATATESTPPAPAVRAPSIPTKPPERVAPQAAVAPQPPVPTPTLESISNVRDVIAQLGEVAQPRSAPPRLQPVASATVAVSSTLNEVQALQVLEREPAPLAAPVPNHDSEVRVVTPEDTQTLTDIRIDAQNNAPPCFAVQLVWSVSPIDVSALVHLAIFDAYTLYNVEGNRQGRKWYGLRLGFFSDPNAATQVANYVRADYTAVAIVPVATKERDRAGGGAKPAVKPARLGDDTPPLKAATEVGIAREGLMGFELLADDRPAAVKRDLSDSPVAPSAPDMVSKSAVTPVAKPASKPVAKPAGKRVMVRKRPDAAAGRAAPGASVPLESTLEILGASTLTLDESREIINDSAIRKPVDRKSGSTSRFSKLLGRLSGN